MSDFALFFQLGIEHITDLAGYDHALFLIVLCSMFRLRDWKKVLFLATAFTIGHSITLALTVMGYRLISVETVEILIPITILLTALVNLYNRKQGSPKGIWQYSMAAGFGLIHGMGFAGFFVAMIAGPDTPIGWPLFYFNLGIEAGQLTIVLGFMALTAIALQVLRIRVLPWRIFWNGLGGGLALWLLAKLLWGLG